MGTVATVPIAWKKMHDGQVFRLGSLRDEESGRNYLPSKIVLTPFLTVTPFLTDPISDSFGLLLEALLPRGRR